MATDTAPSCRIAGNAVQVLRASKGGTGPRRWHTLVRVPVGAKERILQPQPGKSQQGREYRWYDAAGDKWTVRAHDPDPSAGAGSNSAGGWTVRILCGKKSMGPDGTLHPSAIFTKGGPAYSPAAINDVHIPIVLPIRWPTV